MTFQQEIYRKLIHFASFAIPVFYWVVFDRVTMIWITSILCAAVITGEFLRMTVPFLGKIFQLVFGKIIREYEKSAITGASYTMIGSLITILVFEKDLAVFSLMILALSDSLAALVGIRWGKTPLLGKSVQGTLTFLTTALVIVFVVPIIPKVAGVCSAFIATLVELLPSPVNDNLLIPLSVAVSFTVVNLIV